MGRTTPANGPVGRAENGSTDPHQRNKRSHMDMARLERPDAARITSTEVACLGQHVIRYGLVLVLLWIGGMKFTAYEAQGIKGLVENSPLLSWAYAVLSVQGFSNLI